MSPSHLMLWVYLQTFHYVIQLTSSSKRFMTNNSSKQKSQEKTWKNCSSCAPKERHSLSTTKCICRSTELWWDPPSEPCLQTSSCASWKTPLFHHLETKFANGNAMSTIYLLSSNQTQNKKSNLPWIHFTRTLNLHMNSNKTTTYHFLLITRENDGKMETGVYRKPTHIDEYLNWNAHAPNIWKTSTVRSLEKRAFNVYSNEISLNTELNHLETVFTNNNDYPKRVINNIIKSERKKTHQRWIHQHQQSALHQRWTH